MSYCRWSTDDYCCDVYVYRDMTGGWTTHVAESRYVFADPFPPPVPCLPGTNDVRYEEHEARERIISEIIRRTPLQAFDLPCAAETYNDATPGACATRLENLRIAGYRVPRRAIDRLREDEKEGITNPPESEK